MSRLIDEMHDEANLPAEWEQRIADLEMSRAMYEAEAGRYRDIFENAVLGIFQIGLDGRLLNANRAAASLLGYDSSEEFLSTVHYISEIYPFPEEREPALAMLKENGFVKDYEVRNRRKDGSIVWVNANARMVRDEKGNPLYHEGTVQDITERRKIEDQLLESRKLARALLDLPINNTVFVMDVNGKILDHNRNLPLRLGMGDIKITGKNIFDLLPEDVSRSRKLKINDITTSKEIVQFEDQFDGRYLENVVYPMLDNDGHVTRMAVFAYDITDRKSAEEERDRILNMSLDLICTAGFDGYFKYVNPAWERVLGYSREEVLSRPFLDFAAPEDLTAIQELLKDVSSGQAFSNVIRKCMHKDGSFRTFMWTTIPDVEKQVTHCIGHDITNWKIAEEKLIASERRFRSYFELPLVGLGIQSPEKRWISVNDRLCEILGYSRDELMSISWVDHTHPDDLPGNIKHFTTIIDGANDTYFGEKRYIRKDGEIIWVAISAGWVRKPTGELDYAVVVVQDITDRKIMEEQLKEHRDHLEKVVSERTLELQQEINGRRAKEEQMVALVESVIEWIWETDQNNNLTYISPRIYDILGYRPDEVIGKSPFEFMQPSDRNINLMKQIIADRRSFHALQGGTAVHKEGNIVLVEASGAPYYNKDGEFAGYRGSCRDITQQKQTMDILKMHEKELVAKSETLRETNAALRVLLKQRDEDKQEMAEKFVSNIRELILPYISKMKKEHMEPRQKAFLDIITTNLNELMSPFINQMRQFNFTPKEIEVASLVKDGRTTKEIAEIMGIATSAVDSHRNNIRAKLGLVNKDVNLRTYLLSFKEKRGDG